MNEMRRRFVRDGLLADGGEAAMAFDTGVGALLGWIKFVGCLSLATVTLGVTPTAWAQGWSGSVSNNVDPRPGDIPALVLCAGYVWTDDPSYYLSISGTLYVNGNLADQRTTWGLGTANLEPPLQTTLWIGRHTDYRVTCFLSTEFGAGWVEPSLHYPPRTPASMVVDVDNFESHGFANYERYREYRVKDNYTLDYGYTDALVTESFSEVANGCNLRIDTAHAFLNSEGKFQDRYTTFGEPIPACGVNPDCSSLFVQTHNIDSKQSFHRNVHYNCYSVEVWP
ncbi:MAG: hypothetical protein KJ066_19230 [Acidobacteria bacterium]|nr:hypothetical protein [Acidobacteriota bacterium]